jgi:hypothetical protein
MKPSDTQPKLPLWSYDEVFPKKYKLVRERDNLIIEGVKIRWIEWNENESYTLDHYEPELGRFLILDPNEISCVWMTTVITEIIEQRDDYIKFRTTNSVYELFIEN